MLHASEAALTAELAELRAVLSAQQAEHNELEKRCLERGMLHEKSQLELAHVQRERATLLESLPKQKEDLMHTILQQQQAAAQELARAREELARASQQAGQEAAAQVGDLQRRLSEVTRQQQQQGHAQAAQVERLGEQLQRARTEQQTSAQMQAAGDKDQTKLISQ